MFSVKTISRLLTHLVEQGLAERGGVKSFLLPPLRQRPSSGSTSLTGPLPCIRSSPFAGWSCLPVWARPPRAWTLLAEKTGIPSDTLYGYLKGFLRLGVIKRTKEGRAYCYSFNYILWPELKDIVAALVEYQVARLVPREALLI